MYIKVLVYYRKTMTYVIQYEYVLYNILYGLQYLNYIGIFRHKIAIYLHKFREIIFLVWFDCFDSEPKPIRLH